PTHGSDANLSTVAIRKAGSRRYRCSSTATMGSGRSFEKSHSKAHPHAGKAGAQLIVRSLTPGDRAPSMFRQTECQLLGAQAFIRRTAIGYSTHLDRRYYRCHVFEPQSTD